MRKNILIFGHNEATQFIDIYNQYTALFDKEKFEVTVALLTGAPNDEVRSRITAENTVFFNFPKKKIRMLKINAIKKLLALCREKQFEMVICHRYKPAYIMMWAHQFHKIPLLINVMHELKTMSGLNRKFLVACLARKNMLFAGVSNAVRDDIRKSLWYLPKERIITLYNMIDIANTQPKLLSREEARKALNISQDTFLFGNIARLAHNKDHKSLIQAFAEMKSRCPQAKLIVIGDGILEAALKNQAQACNLQDDIIFTGFLPQAMQYMQAFDCFVLPSLQEAFGRVLIEAMIAKLPIIATRVNGIPEVVSEAGILVGPNDAASLSKAMLQVYSLPLQDRHAMGKKAYQRAVDRFSIPVFQQDFWQAARL